MTQHESESQSSAALRDDVVDVVLVGGGIMSAVLGAILKSLEPGFRMRAFERLEAVGLESSLASNNAGTGHAANCELNYTPADDDGVVDIEKALRINEQFEASLQLWATMVERGWIPDGSKIVAPTPHLSFVFGERDVAFLKARHETLSVHPFFRDMAFSTDAAQIGEWAPLITKGRSADQLIAATRVARGTDVNFGRITTALFDHLEAQDEFELSLGVQVKNLRRLPDKTWLVTTKRRDTGVVSQLRSRFVFIGAGGHSLPVLLGTGIPEASGYGGFPVGGMFLWCKNREIVEQHAAKVYGNAKLGAPPMSVPHLDTRTINGKKQLFFGPYAGFSTRFLKHGSIMDLPTSLRPGNVLPIGTAGLKNFHLTTYLIGQVLQSPAQRMEALREYFPEARDEDWELRVAGQRVQIIKRTAEELGMIQFGTEVVTSADGSLAALLGASPGASTSASIILDVIAACFPEKLETERWQSALKACIPSWGVSLADDEDALARLRDRADSILGIGEGALEG